MSQLQYSPRSLAHHSALVFSDDTVVAALLLSLLELDGLTPRFPRPHETPVAAVSRLRPSVALVDCDHEAVASDAFYAAASEAGTAVIIFSPIRARHEIEAAAEARDVRWFTFPVDGPRLHRVLDDALRDATASSDD